MQKEKNLKGFTLIELLVVMLIASILVVVGYSGYIENLRQNRRQDAILALQNQYLAITNNQAISCTVTTPCVSPNGFYNIYYLATGFPPTTGVTGFTNTALSISNMQYLTANELLILAAIPVTGQGQNLDTAPCNAVIYLSSQNNFYPSSCAK